MKRILFFTFFLLPFFLSAQNPAPYKGTGFVYFTDSTIMQTYVPLNATGSEVAILRSNATTANPHENRLFQYKGPVLKWVEMVSGNSSQGGTVYRTNSVTATSANIFPLGKIWKNDDRLDFEKNGSHAFYSGTYPTGVWIKASSDNGFNVSNANRVTITNTPPASHFPNLNKGNRFFINAFGDIQVGVPDSINFQSEGEVFVFEIHNATEDSIRIDFSSIGFKNKAQFVGVGEAIYDLKLSGFESLMIPFEVVNIGEVIILQTLADWNRQWAYDAISQASESTINNTSLFSTISPIVGDVYSTKGFHYIGDGGGAKYIIESSGTVDSKRIFLTANSLMARLLPNADGGVNIRQLGAKPSTTVAYTANIQTALDNFVLVYNYEDTTFCIQAAPIYLNPGQNLILGPKTKIKRLGTTLRNMLATPGASVGTDTTRNVVVQGGIWDYNAATGGSGSVQPDQYAFLFYHTENFIVKDLRIENVIKFGISASAFYNLSISGISFNTESDGIHIMGPGEGVTIDNISGITGDDFVAVSGSDFTANAYDEGDIKNVTIKNIKTDYAGTNGNIISIFPGNNGTRNLVVENVYIENVQGRSNNASLISISQYGTVGDPATEKTTGGVVKNIQIINADGKSVSGLIRTGIDTILNMVVDGVLARDATGYVSFDVGYIDNLTLNDLNFTGSGNVALVQVAAGTEIDNMAINNMTATTSGLTFIQVLDTLGGGRLVVDNANLTYGGVGAAVGIRTISDSMDIEISNSKFDFGGYGTAVTYAQQGGKVRIADSYINTTSGITDNAVAGATATVYAGAYQFTGAAINWCYTYGAGSVFALGQSDIANTAYTRINSNRTIAAGYPQGFVYNFFNYDTSPHDINFNTQTINGTTSYSLPAKTGITMHKVSTTAWECDAVPSSLIIIADIAQDSTGWRKTGTSVELATATNSVGMGGAADATYRLSVLNKPIRHESTGGSNLYTEHKIGGVSIALMGSGAANGLNAADWLDYIHTGKYYLATGGSNRFSLETNGGVNFLAYTSAGAMTGVTSHFGTLTSAGKWITKTAAEMRTDLSLSSTYLPLTGGTMAGNINMGGNAILNNIRIESDSANTVNPAFNSAATWAVTNHTSNSATATRRFYQTWDGTGTGTLTVPSTIPANTGFWVKNLDPTFSLTLVGSGLTTNGNMEVVPGEAVFFLINGTVLQAMRTNARASAAVTNSNIGVTVTTGVGLEGWEVPNEYDGWNIVEVSYRTHSAVSIADLDVQLSRQNSSGSSTGTFASAITVGNRMVNATGSFAVSEGDLIMCQVPNVATSVATGLTMTIVLAK